MKHNNFRKNSVDLIVLDYYDGVLPEKSDLEKNLLKLTKQELIYFIIDCQSKGRFGNGFIHP